ncbi:MAG: hypothetical protein ACI4SM_04750 [Candidatus Gastranaerophilaceae bacterium]
MFENFKDTVSDLAFSAVSYAEEKLSTASGKEKKRMAIEFLICKLPIPIPFKGLASILFAKLIDTAIEKAVSYMNQVKYED